MGRGKDDEKIMEPMFPRLHVNDTEKGGPRAPPRNKMALYEQLSIPSQRFNPSNTSGLIPLTSSSQGSNFERNMHFPSQYHLGGAGANARVAHFESIKKVRDENDSVVPVFLDSETGQQHGKSKNGFDGGKVQNVRDDDVNRGSSSGVGSRKEVRDRSVKIAKACSSRERSIRTVADLSTRETIDGCVKENIVSPDQDSGEIPASRSSRLLENDACSVQKLRAGRQQVDNGSADDVALMIEIGEGTLSRKRSLSYSKGNQSVPDETTNDSECREDRTCGSLELANGDKSDNVSETSMVDSVSSLGLSPDDVVGIIGQKLFWKARRAIVNQRRVFVVQVFELHRLIKVQRLIAGSPHLLLEDATYVDKPSLKDSPSKKLPPEFTVKPVPQNKHKDDTEKPSQKMECSAENAVGRTSLSSVKNGTQPSKYGPFLGNPSPSPANGDNKMNPWCFNQMPGQQWLVPVMSPSEGLIYKPYPAPGLMGSVCGDFGPYGQTPMTGNFMASAYGGPAPPHQGLGVHPGALLPGHSYFPPYGMPFMNRTLSGSAMEPMNQFSAPGSHAPSGQLSRSGANFSIQHQSSCNMHGENNAAAPPVTKSQTSKHAEQERCTASSPGERAEKNRTGSTVEGKNTPPLLPTAEAIRDTEQRTRVIRVVPHNPRSATESVARIFQSIQRERKLRD
ncbi:EARLY FLOWERING 3 [Hibiscus trionum]|uniref:EARLY FLOWERING 3 n=1 Tax=Hibiscus trionum TaxID=183268 RepID=A0A9W7I3G7_HIBTR|nr:EARLY FLOWERING 3 [Hibiscus trionum]